MDSLRCKRIINGKTYNTETATSLARWESDDLPLAEGLFKTRLGAYFLLVDDQTRPGERIRPLTLDEAKQWMEEHCQTELYESEFEEVPEAGAADPEARITLRIPRSLHIRIEGAAKKHNQSLNAWILRCLENGVQEKGDEA